MPKSTHLPTNKKPLSKKRSAYYTILSHALIFHLVLFTDLAESKFLSIILLYRKETCINRNNLDLPASLKYQCVIV